jgi:translocation and assembly module TamA
MLFWPVPKDWGLGGGTFVGRLEGGWVVSESADGIPSPNLFRTGGSESVRGYDFLSLGVKQGSATVGGRVLGVGSLEYQHPISGPWYAAAFVDAGNAADTWQTWRAVFGYGAGVRWRSPIGPIRLDVAYGEADRQWKVHFSVGYVF